MRKRKERRYAHKIVPIRRKLQTEDDLLPNPEHTRSFPALRLLSMPVKQRKPRMQRYRNYVRAANWGSVGLSVGTTISGFLLLHLSLHMDVFLYSLVTLCGIFQVPCILLYWSFSLQYSELVRRTFHVSPTHIHSLSKSCPYLSLCLLECVFNLIPLLPAQDFLINLSLFGQNNRISLFEILYLCVLFRNYHLIRCLYWNGRFSDARTKLYARLTSIPSLSRYILRCFLTKYCYEIVAGGYFLSVLVSATVGYVVEYRNEERHDIYLDLWVTAYTSSNIGYGDLIPASFLYRFVLISSAVLGLVLFGVLSGSCARSMKLNRNQEAVCREIVLRKRRLREKGESVKLIQRWWRLMRTRRLKILNFPILQHFYTHLNLYQKLLVRRKRLNFNLFPSQIEALESKSTHTIRSLNEYLIPVNAAMGLVVDIERTEYRQFLLIRSLKRRVRKITGTSPSSKGFDSATPTPISKKGRNVAFSGLAAYRQVQMRLLPPHPSSHWSRDA